MFIFFRGTPVCLLPLLPSLSCLAYRVFYGVCCAEPASNGDGIGDGCMDVLFLYLGLELCDLCPSHMDLLQLILLREIRAAVELEKKTRAGNLELRQAMERKLNLLQREMEMLCAELPNAEKRARAAAAAAASNPNIYVSLQ